MGNNTNNEYSLYKDIQLRTGGEIYLGVVGPVRTGKSTFIKRFMDLMVLPFMKEDAEKKRALDELPQSAGGRTITTTEPKFIPKTAAQIKLNGELSVKVRLVDCVGYMVDGATGHMEEDMERMVKTPWSSHEIPFTQAAEIGTKKVISEHSTIGIVITTDGSITDIKREAYLEAEERAILELKNHNKPFLVIVNTTKPYSQEAQSVAKEIGDRYGVTAICMNLEQMKEDDIHRIMENVLYEFPIRLIEFYMPKWVDVLKRDHVLKQKLISDITDYTKNINKIKDLKENPMEIEGDYCRKCILEKADLSDGSISYILDLDDKYYYDMLGELLGSPIDNEYQLLSALKQYAAKKCEYDKVAKAMDEVKGKGYGVVTPLRDEITLDQPEIVKHGNKYGVKIIAKSPSIHMIKADVITEIAPIVGTQKQAEDLVQYIEASNDESGGIWDTNIFGKSVEELVNDGMRGKISMIGEESQEKLQETMQKIVNESNGSMICIII